jgi:hypothetical protein
MLISDLNNKEMKSKILIIFALLSFLSSSCFIGREVGNCELTEAQKQIIPYEKGEIIGFIDETGLPGDAKVIKSEINRYREGVGTMVEHYVTHNFKTVTLKLEASNLEIGLQLNNSSDCLSHPYIIDLGYLRIYEINNRSWYFVFKIDAEGNFLIGNSDSFPDSSVAFYDSLYINDKPYYDVVEGNILSEDDINWQLFYNKEYGILQIKKDGDDYLTINR